MRGTVTLKISHIAVGLVLAACLGLCLAGWLDVRRTRQATERAFQTIDAYIGACQKAGVLPTVEELNARLAKEVKK